MASGSRTHAGIQEKILNCATCVKKGQMEKQLTNQTLIGRNKNDDVIFIQSELDSLLATFMKNSNKLK